MSAGKDKDKNEWRHVDWWEWYSVTNMTFCFQG